MIKLEARIKLFDSNDGTVNNAQFNNNNNISYNSTANSSLGQIVGKEVKQTRPFLLDNTPLVGGEDHEIPKTSDMYVLADRVNYFIGSLVSGEDGTFPGGSSYSITINGADFNAITIVFDKDDEVWPTEITVNGESYTNDDPTFTVGGFGGTVGHLEVTISKLNKPNKGLIVTGIYVDITIMVDEKNLDSFTYGLYDRASNDEPSYGVVSNSGTLSFVDSTGEILDYANMRLLKDLTGVEICVSNTITKESQVFIKAFTQEWEYDNDSRVVTLTIADGLSAVLQNIPFYNDLFHAYKSSGDRAFVEIYNDIYEMVPSYFSMPSYDELNADVKSLIENISADSYKPEEGNLWAAIDAFAKAVGLHIYYDNNKIKIEVSQ